MAALSHSESRRLYSWWWDSHNSPKNSKWLQENLTDMDGKVKSMIKLIEEDADSFARRAEMYYKKRPELMKLVEEFYRAYRALAERYNHATGELRHAHRTIAKAFPDQLPPELIEDSHSKSGGPHTPESKGPVRALFEADDSLDDDSQSLSPFERDKEREEFFNNENQNFKSKILHESERAGKAEGEVIDLKKALADLQAEKEDVIFHYQECLEKLSKMEGELVNAQRDSIGLCEKASWAEIEARTLKETLFQLEVEKNAGLIKLNIYLEKISDLEAMLSQAQEDTRGLDNKAVQAENEVQSLKAEISRLEFEKEEAIRQYKFDLGKISELENIISVMEEEAKLLKKKAEIAETEVSELKKALAYLSREKEASSLQYKSCLEKISNLEKDLSRSKLDVDRLNKEVLTGNSKLKSAEEKCSVLETTNQSLIVEANNLSEMIAIKDKEVSEKQEELEKLQIHLKNEHLHHAEIEATLQNLQNLHSQSQDDQKALAVELQQLLQMLKELELSKNDLEKEIQRARDENETLSQKNFLSAAFMENMQNEILSLHDIKERLEKEVLRHMGLSDSLEKEISCLKEEIKGLNLSYRALFEQVESNSKLKQICEEGSNEKAILLKKIEELEEAMKEKETVESSLSSMKSELENSQEKFKVLQETCQFFNGEKASLVSEKASLLSQLQSVTENMHKLLERNAVLENSLSNAKVELEGLREKSKGLEEICELLKNERLHLLSERGSLVLKLESVENRLESVEKRYIGLEEKYAEVEKEKKAMQFQVKQLEVSLSAEKQENSTSQLESQTRLAGLENEIHVLKEDSRWKQKETEEELEKALKAQFEITILQKFIKDMEEKNYSLIIECQKHVEASKLAEKVVSELESESLEQQMESELLLDEIERLRSAIYQVFLALGNGADFDKFENEENFMDHILRIIENMKCSVSKHEDDKQLLLVQNSVLLTLLEQFESKGMEIQSQKVNLEKEFQIIAEKLDEVKNERDKLVEMNGRLRSDAIDGHQLASAFEAELRDLCSKQDYLHKCYNALQQMYSLVNQDNMSLMKKFSDLKEEKFGVDQDNELILLELLATANESMVLKSFGSEKIKEVRLLRDDLNRQHDLNCVLEKEMSVLREKLELQKVENLQLKDSVHKLEMEIQEIREYNVSKGAELSNTTMKLEASEHLNSKLCSKVDELKLEVQESLQIRGNLENNIVQLSENNSNQKKEIEILRVDNANLNSELGLLREEIQEKITKEQILRSELEEKKNEFELWENEASVFYFDLEISSVLFQNKVHELALECQALENERDSKNSEIEQMKGEVCSKESEISGLKSKISAYAPVVASLQYDLSFLEHNVVLQTKQRKVSHSQELEIPEVASHPSSPETLPEDQTLLTLKNLQKRLKAVGKSMQETNKSTSRRRSNPMTNQETPTTEIEHSKPRRSFGKEKHEHTKKKGHYSNDPTPKLQKIKTKTTETRNGMLMKDIPLDQVSDGIMKRGNIRKDEQMLELWETAEDGVTIGESLRRSFKMTERDIVYDQFESVKHKSEPPSTDSDMERELGVDKLEVLISSQLNQGSNDRKILESLASDAQKLENLQITVQNLMSKLEMSKTNKKAKNVDFETVNEQLVEAEETVLHLVDLNGQLAKDIEMCPSPNSRASVQMKEAVKTKRRKVTEQARKGSERIGRLQLELQKIQFMLLKMEDEKKNKVRNKFFRNKTIVLRDFIYNGRKNSGKRKNCGCFRPSSSRNGSTSP